jgi:hypothetical protein
MGEGRQDGTAQTLGHRLQLGGLGHLDEMQTLDRGAHQGGQCRQQWPQILTLVQSQHQHSPIAGRSNQGR